MVYTHTHLFADFVCRSFSEGTSFSEGRCIYPPKPKVPAVILPGLLHKHFQKAKRLLPILMAMAFLSGFAWPAQGQKDKWLLYPTKVDFDAGPGFSPIDALRQKDCEIE